MLKGKICQKTDKHGRGKIKVSTPLPPRGARLRELEAGQRVALHAHAMHVWGAGWQQRPDKPVVFNLTGKSASEVAAVAGCVSQVVTPTEERQALNELNSGLLRVGS